MEFKDLFPQEHVVLAMLHLKGDDRQEVLERAKREIDIYNRSDVDGIIVENYFGNYDNVIDVLEYLKTIELNSKVGLNLLNNDSMGFELVKKYDLDFLQFDSVVGHLKERDEITQRAFLNMWRKRLDVCLLGGVRFKYQPILSKNSVEIDLEIATERCDAICVTGSGTGIETPFDKIKTFRKALKEFPLIAAAGVTTENITEQFKFCDGAVIGSAFKDTGLDTGDVDEEKVVEIMNIVKEMRKSQ